LSVGGDSNIAAMDIRYPLLAAATRNKLYVFDLRTGELKFERTIPENSETYGMTLGVTFVFGFSHDAEQG
jgi:outer membrane protein assembly factor BamB